jgi:hypothetical protein
LVSHQFAPTLAAGGDKFITPEDTVMTMLAREGSHAKQDNCEVRCEETDQVIGFVTTGGVAACLEHALAKNGFSLTPAVRPTPRLKHITAAA